MIILLAILAMCVLFYLVGLAVFVWSVEFCVKQVRSFVTLVRPKKTAKRKRPRASNVRDSIRRAYLGSDRKW